MRQQTRQRLKVAMIIVLCFYVSSYIVMSRLGFRRSDSINGVGFYFIDPCNERAAMLNKFFRVIYYPLVFLDNLLGTGRPLATDPIWELSNGVKAIQYLTEYG